MIKQYQEDCGKNDTVDKLSKLIDKAQIHKVDLPVKEVAGMPLSELFYKYYAHKVKSGKWSKGSIIRYKREYVNYLKRIGNVDVKTITAVIAEDIRESFEKAVPYDCVKGKKRKKEGEPLNVRTVNKHISALSDVFEWAANKRQGFVDYNPFGSLTKVDNRNPDNKSRPFKPEELRKFVAALADNYDERYPEKTWIPLIFMYTGARPNEIASLYTDSIKSVEGIDYFEIKGDVARKQIVKNKGSKRNIPIHRKLKELGFMEYVASLREQGQERLWPNLQPGPDDKFYNSVTGSYFNDLIDEKVSADPLLKFYSLRSTFINAIEEKGVNIALAGGENDPFFDRAKNDITGHTQQGMASIVYRRAKLPIMAKVMELVEYDIDFTAIKAKLGKK